MHAKNLLVETKIPKYYMNQTLIIQDSLEYSTIHNDSLATDHHASHNPKDNTQQNLAYDSTHHSEDGSLGEAGACSIISAS
jgi:hypothetical protein